MWTNRNVTGNVAQATPEFQKENSFDTLNYLSQILEMQGLTYSPHYPMQTR